MVTGVVIGDLVSQMMGGLNSLKKSTNSQFLETDNRVVLFSMECATFGSPNNSDQSGS